MRKLAWGGFSFSAAIFAANYILWGRLPLYGAALLLLLGAGLASLRRKWLRGPVIALLAAAAGFGCFSAKGAYVSAVLDRTDGQTLMLTAELLDDVQVYDGYCRADVLISGGAPRVKAILYDNSMTLSAAEAGQAVRFTAKARSADTRYGEKYDYYFSRGFYLILNTRSDVSISRTDPALRSLPQRLRRAVSLQVDRLFPQDTAPFVKSLMLGDKSDFYNDTAAYSAVSRAGLMHTVAVSGMHIAFLIGLLQLVLGTSRRSSLICIALIWAFVLITGSTPSAVRAGFMQTLLLAAPVVRRENDPLTALATALALILLINPYAAASVSLQLSFGAMAGIILFSARLYRAIDDCIASDKLRRLLSYPLRVLSCSLAVMVFTVPLTAAHFGSVNVLAPVSNILALWAVSLCFCGAYAVCALGALLPAVGAAGAWLVSWSARYILAVSALVARVPFSTVYLESGPVLLWLILSYAAALLFVFSKGPVWLRLLLPTAISAAALSIALLSVKAAYSGGSGVISVLDVGQGQCVCAISGDSTVLVDCGGQGSGDNAGETAGAYLRNRGRSKVDALILTHLHSDHCGGVPMLAEMADIGVIILPADADDSDAMLPEILSSAEEHGIPVKTVSSFDTVSFDGISTALMPSLTGGDANERGLAVKLSVSDYDALITGDLPASAERALSESYELGETEMLLVGHHGSRYSSTGSFLQAVGGDTAVVSVGYNSYGHPTYETLERLDAYGYTVYRTDLNGTVEIRIG